VSLAKKAFLGFVLAVATSLGSAGALKVTEIVGAWKLGVSSDSRALAELQNKKWIANFECAQKVQPFLAVSKQNTTVKVLICPSGDIFLESILAGESKPDVSVWVDRTILKRISVPIPPELNAQGVKIQQTTSGRVMCMKAVPPFYLYTVTEDGTRCYGFYRNTYTNEVSSRVPVECVCPPVHLPEFCDAGQCKN